MSNRKRSTWYWIVLGTGEEAKEPLHKEGPVGLTDYLATFVTKRAAVLFAENKGIENFKPKMYSAPGIARRFQEFTDAYLYNERQIPVWKGKLSQLAQAFSGAAAN